MIHIRRPVQAIAHLDPVLPEHFLIAADVFFRNAHPFFFGNGCFLAFNQPHGLREHIPGNFTGFLGGVEVGIGVLVYLGILYQTGDQLLAGLGFSIGLIALLLAHSELFTENFLLPIAALVAREGTWLDLAKLWGGTLLSNLLGGWLIMAIIVLAFPDWHPVLAETAEHFIEAPLTLEFAALAILGGAVITLMTRMQTGTESVPARYWG